MLTKEEIAAIREEIAGEPETAPARRLLAEIDLRDEEERVWSRYKTLGLLRNTMGLLRNTMGYSEAEAEAVLAFMGGGGKLVEEEVRCWVCGGSGVDVTEMECFGLRRWCKCQKCWGRGEVARLAIPKSESESMLPLNPLRTYAGYDRTES
jgi:hypothetical protein